MNNKKYSSNIFKELEDESGGQVILNEGELKEIKLHRYISLKCVDMFLLFWY